MKFECSCTPEGVTLRALPEQKGRLFRLLSRPAASPDLSSLPSRDYALGTALDRVQYLADGMAGQPDSHLVMEGDTLRLGHRLVAAIDGRDGEILGLPPLTDLVLHTDTKGIIGQAGFRLHYFWTQRGKRREVERDGAILKSGGKQRIPLWMLDALDVADRITTGKGAAGDWEALARFRQALSPSSGEVAEQQENAHLEMSAFLKGLEISLVDRLSISPNDGRTDFEIVPFSRRADDAVSGQESGLLSEKDAELEGTVLRAFQGMLRRKGVLDAYSLASDGIGRRYVVIDSGARPALETMVQVQGEGLAERKDFIDNPTRRIREAYERRYQGHADYAALLPEEREERLARSVGNAFVETEEYSARVVGSVLYIGDDPFQKESSGTVWVPEDFPPYAREVVSYLKQMSPAELEAFSDQLEKLGGGKEDGQEAETGKPESILVAGHEIPATASNVQTLERLFEQVRKSAPHDGDAPGEEGAETRLGKVILATRSNLEQRSWEDRISPRKAFTPASCPESIKTLLKAHQRESLEWQVKAWQAGMPGILNADEQGLGKTLQTITFLVWLNRNMQHEGSGRVRPILIVAPTTLLRNWEAEVEKHVARGEGLGDLVRLYGQEIGKRRKQGAEGKDIDSGEDKLSLSDVKNRTEQGRPCWILTTYTTLMNYQYSFGRLHFSAVVFDEIQAVKNPYTLGAKAARVIKADFRIGLTGTPVENDTSELWAIMDVLAAMPEDKPGYLGSLREFRETYGTPDETGMKELHDHLFGSTDTLPPLAIRRLKDSVARDLPPKKRYLYPRVMPDEQARVYEKARDELLHGNRGAALKILHHIRSVSVHPALQESMPPDEFIAMSARLTVTFELLEMIRSKGERVLVFIENHEMQYRFIRLVKERFGLKDVGLINGRTDARKRQDIVNGFQEHLRRNDGFDLLVLSPKAAGVGLTLTAATHVIHLSRWWNPAVEEQCNDRVHRIGQEHPVSIHVPMAVHPGYQYQSFDLLLQTLMQKKRHLASSVLWPMGATKDDDNALEKDLKIDAGPHGRASDEDIIMASMQVLAEKGGVESAGPEAEGRWRF